MKGSGGAVEHLLFDTSERSLQKIFSCINSRVTHINKQEDHEISNKPEYTTFLSTLST